MDTGAMATAARPSSGERHPCQRGDEQSRRTWRCSVASTKQPVRICDRRFEEASRRTSQKPSGSKGRLGRRTTTKVTTSVDGRRREKQTSCTRAARAQPGAQGWRSAGTQRLRPRGKSLAHAAEPEQQRTRTRGPGTPWARSGQLTWVESLCPTQRSLSR